MLMDRLNSGADFSQLAMDYSEDMNSAATGGDLGYVPESALNQSDPMLEENGRRHEARPGQPAARTERRLPHSEIGHARIPRPAQHFRSPSPANDPRHLAQSQRTAPAFRISRQSPATKPASATTSPSKSSKPAANSPTPPKSNTPRQVTRPRRNSRSSSKFMYGRRTPAPQLARASDATDQSFLPR